MRFPTRAVAIAWFEAAGEWRDWSGHLVHDISLDKTELVQGVAELIRHNVEVLGVPSEQICIVAPWWLHLASITRSLVQALPEYEFNRPGLSPFGQNLDNFWYKVARIALTHSAPGAQHADCREYTVMNLYEGELLADEQFSGGFSVRGVGVPDAIAVGPL